MHEAAHRLLFANRRANDLVGRWLLGYPSFTSTDAYRRVHMAHHRQEFGPDEPDIPLYAGYPISPASFRRKLVRDATGRTGFKLFRQQFAGFRSSDARVRHTLWKILLVQAVLFGAAIVGGVWWVYPVFWVLPYLTVWRVINRLRVDRRARRHGRVDRPSGHDALRPPVVVGRARSSSRSTSAGISRTTSTPACRCDTCPSTTGRCTRPATSRRASSSRATARSGVRCATGSVPEPAGNQAAETSST